MRPDLFSLPLELRCSSPLHQMFLSASCNHTYFLTTESSTDLVWRPRHEFSLPICPPSVSTRIGTSVTGVASRRLGTRLWGSKTDEGYLLHPILSALSGDQDELVEYYDGDHLQSKPLLDDLIVDSGNQFGRRNPFNMFDETQNFSKWYQPIEEPWLMESSLLGKYAAEALTLLSEMEEGEEETSGVMLRELEYTAISNNLSFNLDSSASQELLYEVSSHSRTYSSAERQQPVEEPWFLCPPISPREKDVGSVSDAPTERDPLLDEKTQVEYPGELKNASEVFMSDKNRNLLSDDDSILNEILINSSICTMQRIAVLEDGNLVEILLEPVKSIVQCDSVYLGAVTKLVPHMGGAFVNIGNPRPSLMDINHYREPFIFPPFAQSVKGKISNTSSVTNVGERSDVSHSEEIASDHIQTTDLENENHLVKDRGAYECDDFEDHEAEDDFDDEEVQTRNLFEDDDHHDTFQDIIKDTTDDLNGNGSYIKDHVGPLNNYGCDSSSKLNWAFVRKGTKIVVQVVKEGLGTKGPTLTAYPKLRSRFWVLKTRSNNVGISKKISGVERTRLRVIAQSLKPRGFGLTARTVAAGRPLQELRKDLEGLLSTWRSIMEHAKSAALAADEGVEGAVPVILHQAMSQTLSVVQDYFTEKVKRMIVDSPRTYHEVTNYLQELAPDLCDRVELHNTKVPLFDEFNIEEEIDNLINKRVPLPNGGSLVIEQTEALVSIDVNGGHGMFGQGTSQEKAVLEVNLAAAKQIARELRLRDIGGIIVVDFIDMHDDANKRLVYEEVKKAVDRDRSMVKVSELSKHGLMEITRKRVRPSVTFMISEPCTCCHGTGRVEALETSFSKIEHEICRLLASMEQRADPQNPKSWPRLVLRVDGDMCEYLTAGKKTRLAILSSSLKVWILMKVARNFTRGAFEVKLLTDEKHQMAAPLIEAGTSAGSSKRTKLFSVKKWKTTSSRAGQRMN